LTAKRSADQAPIPTTSVIFGYGPMLPLVAAAIGAWVLPAPWPGIAVDLAILWGALILSFVAGVRRGFGFGAPLASTRTAMVTMLAYFLPAGVALVLGWAKLPAPALALLGVGYALVAALDREAALAGDAPAHFARLRPGQMGLAVVALGLLLARMLVHP
jgi:hypothetical protein